MSTRGEPSTSVEVTTVRRSNRRGLITAAVRVAADASASNGHGHGRTLVKRSLLDDLRRELDALGLGDDWRTLHDIVRVEDRQPQNGRVS